MNAYDEFNICWLLVVGWLYAVELVGVSKVGERKDLVDLHVLVYSAHKHGCSNKPNSTTQNA